MNNRALIVGALLKVGVDPSSRFYTHTPIWLYGVGDDPQILAQLVEGGLDLSQRCSYDSPGFTVLHHCANERPSALLNLDHIKNRTDRLWAKNHVSVFKLLIEKGANLYARDNCGFTPILRAAIGSGIDDDVEAQLPNFLLLEVLLENNNIERIDKIQALEYAGACILKYDENQNYFYLGFEYWRRALVLRLKNTDGCLPILKEIPSAGSHARIIEWTTLGDLQEIENDPSQRKIQALLVQMRVCFDISWKAVRFEAFWKVYVGADMPHGCLLPVLSLSWTILEKITSGHFNPVKVRSSVNEIVSILVRAISLLKRGDLILNSELLKTTLDLIILTSSATSNLSHSTIASQKKVIVDKKEMKNLYDVVTLFNSSPYRELLNKESKKFLCSFVRDIRDVDGSSFLHYACKGGSPLRQVRLFRFLGLDPNLVDNNRNTPLHILAQNYGGVDTDEIARLLIEHEDHPAHLDLVNNVGMTVADIFMKNRRQQQLNNVVHDLPDWCLHKGVLKLKCLTARIICSANVPYLGECQCPQHLHSFINVH